MRTIKKLASNAHRYVLWALISVFFWGWVFSLAGDAPRAKKLTVFTSVEAIDCAALKAALSERLPDGINLVQVHPFRYAAFDTSEAEAADIFIVTEEEAKSMAKYLSHIEGDDGLVVDGAVIAVVLIPEEVFKNTEFLLTETHEPVYICFGSRSVHTKSLNGSSDDAALELFDTIKKLFAEGGNL